MRFTAVFVAFFLLPTAATATDGAPPVMAGKCIHVHDLWKSQLQTTSENDGHVPVQRWIEEVYRPNAEFWKSYLGDEGAFRSWAEKFSLPDDARRSAPLDKDIGAGIPPVVRRVAQFAGQPLPCSDWYIIFGPGWTNMGGVGNRRMVVDFMGMPKKDPSAAVDLYLPHEVNHLLWEEARPTGAAHSLLERILNEGFATYLSAIYRRATAAKALGYTPEEYRWARDHEQELWQTIVPQLASEDRTVANAFLQVSSQIQPSAPGKIGYFLGYRIVEAYVAAHGPGSWKRLYRIAPSEILSDSGYGKIRRAPAHFAGAPPVSGAAR